MIRPTAIMLAALIAAAPLSQAVAQDRGHRGDREQQVDQRRQDRQDREQERPRLSAAQALSIARSRARGARFVGTMPSRGDTYVFRFEDRDGRLFDIRIDARGG